MLKLLLMLIAGCAWADDAPLSFDTAYKQILSRSLRVETQQLEVEGSRERRKTQWGAFGPVVSLEASDNRASEPVFGSTLTSRSAALTGRVNLWRSGGDLAGLRGSEKNLEAQGEKLRSEKQVSEEEAAQVLVSYIASVQRHQLNEKIVVLKDDSLRIARERYSKGLLPMQEVDKVSIDLDNARAGLIDSEVREADSRAKLKTFLGHDRVLADWPWRQAVVSGQKLETEEFRLEARPDWRSLSATLSEQGFRKKQSFGSLLPTVDLSASYGNADLANSGRRDWSTQLTLSVPIFNGFRDYSAWRVQALTERGAQIRLESLNREAPAEIESLRYGLRAARESAVAREKTAKVSERLYADNLQRFRLGRASVNDLALDQNRLLQSQLLEVDGWSALHLSFARLCHGLGGTVSGAGTCAPAPAQ